MSTVHNFSAGPGALPPVVRHRLMDEFARGSNQLPAIVEVSHRGARFLDIAARLQAALRRHLQLPDTHEILLMSGGAQLQFALLPMNLAADTRAAYLETGHWSRLAIRQAGSSARIDTAGSSAADGFRSLPAVAPLAPDTAYLHYCGNETANGVQFAAPPVADVPRVADLSSEILSRPYPYEQLGAFYASAQKNLGIAGLTVVVVRRDLLARAPNTLPPFLSYRSWAAQAPMPNTPCSIAWFATLAMLEWLDGEGGVPAVAAHNAAKAALLYTALDRSSLYVNDVAPAARSLMNVVFQLRDPAREAAFLAAASAEGFVGLEGHRAVGGLRASLYNAVPLAAVEALVAFLAEFERRS